MLNIKNIKKKINAKKATNSGSNLNNDNLNNVESHLSFEKFNYNANSYFNKLPFSRQWFMSFENVNLKEFDKYVSRIVSPSLIQVYPSKYAVDSIFFRIVALGGLMFYVVAFFALDIANEIDSEIIAKFYILLLLILYVGFIFTIFHIIKGIFVVLKNFFVWFFNIFIQKLIKIVPKANNHSITLIKFKYLYKFVLISLLLLLLCFLIKLNIMFNAYIDIIDYLDGVNESVWTRYQSIERPVRYNIRLNKNANYSSDLTSILNECMTKLNIRLTDYDSKRFNEIHRLLYKKGTFIFDYPGNYMHLLDNPGQKEGYWAFRGYHNEVFNVDRVHFVRTELQILSSKLKIFLSLIPIILIEKDISSSLFYLKLTWNSLMAPDVYKFFSEPFMGNYFNLFKYNGLSFRHEDPLKFLRYDITRANSIAAASGIKNMVYNVTTFVFWKRFIIENLGLDFIRDIELNFHLRNKLYELNYFLMPPFLNEILYHKNFFFGIIHLYSDRFIQILQDLQEIQTYSKQMLICFDRTFIKHILGAPLVAQYWFNGFLLQPEDPFLIRLPMRDPISLNSLFASPIPKNDDIKKNNLILIKPELNHTMFLIETKELLNPRNYPRQNTIIKSYNPQVYVKFSPLILEVPAEFFDLGNKFDITGNPKALFIGERRYFKSLEFLNKNVVINALNSYYTKNNWKSTLDELEFFTPLSWESDTIFKNYLQRHTIITGGGPHFWDMPKFISGYINDEFFPNEDLIKFHKIRFTHPLPERDIKYKFLTTKTGNIDYNAHKVQFCYNPGTLIKWSHYFKTLYTILQDPFIFSEKQVINLPKHIQQQKFDLLTNITTPLTEAQVDEYYTQKGYKKKYGIKTVKYWKRRDPMLYDELNFPDWLARDWREIKMVFKFANNYNPCATNEIKSAYFVANKKNILINKIAPYLQFKYKLEGIIMDLHEQNAVGKEWYWWRSSDFTNNLVLSSEEELNILPFDNNKHYCLDIIKFKNLKNNKNDLNTTQSALLNIYLPYYYKFINHCPYPHHFELKNYEFWHFANLIDHKNRNYNLYDQLYNKKIKLKHQIVRHIFILAENLSEYCEPPQSDDYLLSAEDRSLMFLNSKNLKHFVKKERIFLKNNLMDFPVTTEFVDRIIEIKAYSKIIKNIII